MTSSTTVWKEAFDHLEAVSVTSPFSGVTEEIVIEEIL